MKCLKTLLAIGVSTLFVVGCTTVEEPAKAEIKTTTSVNGVEVTSVAYKCRIDQSESEYQGKFEKPFLVEFLAQDKAVLVERSGSYPLIRVKSASGSKYESIDGQQMFWSKGNQATITFNHETLTDCYTIK